MDNTTVSKCNDNSNFATKLEQIIYFCTHNLEKMPGDQELSYVPYHSGFGISKFIIDDLLN